jgi:group II intron reverse transcriptase/maturase
MRSADTGLGIIRERGKRGLPLRDLSRQLYNPALYRRAYARLYTNNGAMPPGSTPDTVEAMSLAKIATLLDDLRHERYRWTPVRRTSVPKKDRKTLRPLGLPSWSDKLLQEVIRALLEAYDAPQFSNHSHGFRPGRGCPTALQTVQETWTGTQWYIEGDMAQCFERIDHQVWLSMLREKILDQRFLRLLQPLLQAGYLEDWHYHTTLSGTPQGAIVSPLLSHLYLDKLDKYIEGERLPAYTRGQERQKHRRDVALMTQAYKRRKQGRLDEAEALTKEAQQLPTIDPYDLAYRRLHYIRYADDWLLGFVGPKEEAEAIKAHLKACLHETLKRALSQEKPLLTHATTGAARFLGYEIVTHHNEAKRDHSGHRTLNGHIGLRLPNEVIEKKRALYMRGDKVRPRPALLLNDDDTIVQQYQAEYRGLVQYYLLAQNVAWLWRLHWGMQTSLLKTLAAQHKASLKQMFQKYRATTTTPAGPMRCLAVVVEREGRKPLVARFGGIPLRRQKEVKLVDRDPPHVYLRRNEFIKRLLAGACALCASTTDCEVHHVRKLADLKTQGRAEKPLWIRVMASRRRKTLVVCRRCHEAIHAGRPLPQRVSA